MRWAPSSTEALRSLLGSLQSHPPNLHLLHRHQGSAVGWLPVLQGQGDQVGGPEWACSNNSSPPSSGGWLQLAATMSAASTPAR